MRIQRTSARRFVPFAIAAVVITLGASGCAQATSVTFHGHGYGHGRGMGQWGAYGYAVDNGWSASQIADHYYGGTISSPLGSNPVQRVLLQANAGRDLIVVQEQGHIVTSIGNPTPGARAVRVRRVDDTRFDFFDGAGCGGPWTLRKTVITAELIVAPIVRSEDRTEMLQECQASGQELVRGSLIAVHSGSTIQSVNRIDTENMLRSVIAREMSPSWANAGSGRGFQALAAQAVAARSYLNFGDTRWNPIATTCDGGACQAYSGVAHRNPGTSIWTVYEDARTDFVVRSTAGEVRRFGNGRVAATEFSASTGGWTLGPVFPAVVDAGDATVSNPNHNWTVTLPSSTVETAFDRRQGRDLGPLQDLVVLARNGIGADGGRVVSVRASFSNADVVVSGDEMRSMLGLKSNWFTPTAT